MTFVWNMSGLCGTCQYMQTHLLGGDYIVSQGRYFVPSSSGHHLCIVYLCMCIMRTWLYCESGQVFCTVTTWADQSPQWCWTVTPPPVCWRFHSWWFEPQPEIIIWASKVCFQTRRQARAKEVVEGQGQPLLRHMIQSLSRRTEVSLFPWQIIIVSRRRGK